MHKKINIYNIKSYLRNKIYNHIANIKIREKISQKIENSNEVINNLKYKTDKDIEIKFNDNYKIICPVKNIEAVIETCVNEDYTNGFYKIKQGDLIFDIGANIGSFSVYAAKKGAKVIAFEPDPFNIKYLSKNIEINNLQKNIKVYDLAVSNNIGTVNLSSNDNHACGSIVDNLGTTDSIVVSTITIDKVIEDLNINIINLFKIDVEGAEYIILPSISEENYNKIENIIGEFHLFKENQDLNFNKIKNTLKPYFRKIRHKIPYYFWATK